MPELLRPTASLLHFLGNAWQHSHWLSRCGHDHAPAQVNIPLGVPALSVSYKRQAERLEEKRLSPDANNSQVEALTRTQPPA